MKRLLYSESSSTAYSNKQDTFGNEVSYYPTELKFKVPIELQNKKELTLSIVSADIPSYHYYITALNNIYEVYDYSTNIWTQYKINASSAFYVQDFESNPSVQLFNRVNANDNTNPKNYLTFQLDTFSNRIMIYASKSKKIRFSSSLPNCARMLGFIEDVEYVLSEDETLIAPNTIDFSDYSYMFISSNINNTNLIKTTNNHADQTLNAVFYFRYSDSNTQNINVILSGQSVVCDNELPNEIIFKLFNAQTLQESVLQKPWKCVLEIT